MRRLIAILMALALAMAVLTSCAGSTGNDSPVGDGVSEIAEGEAVTAKSVKDVQPDSDTEADSVEPDVESDDDYVDAINAQTADAMGECGENLSWYFKDGVLVIKGTGEMTNYYSDAYDDYYAPWVTYNGGEIKGEILLAIVEEGVTSVGDLAFYGLDNLSGAVLPDSLERIGEGAFYRCTSLTSVNFPDSLEVIGDEAFSWCANLASVSFPESLKTIGKEAFNNCYSLTSIAVPITVEKIGRHAFYKCSNADIILPDGITEINIWDSYSHTKSVTIPASATKINSFGYQQEIIFLGDAPEIDTREVKNSAGEVIGTAINGLPEGFKPGSETGSFINETVETGVTIYYSGKGFEKYIELCPQYHWIKK